MYGKIDRSKFTMVELGRFIISCRRIFFTWIKSEMFPFSARLYICPPFFGIFIPYHALESAKVIRADSPVKTIFRKRTWSKILATVIQSVVIFVIALLSHNFNMHLESFSPIFSSDHSLRIVALGGGTPMGIPNIRRNPLEIGKV